MRLDFTKMHGIGNDFVVLNAVEKPVVLSDAQIRRLADRRLGVGCDQVLIVQPSTHADADFDYRIFNADGGEVEHCGNGARCFALFVREQGLTDKTRIPVYTNSGLIELTLEDDGQVTVNMGIPNFEPGKIPFSADARAADYPIALGDKQFRIGVASIGNPHAVLDVDDVDCADVDGIGAVMEVHERFPKGVNVGFRQRLYSSHIRLRVFERGVGETRACGTGACAAVVIGHMQGELSSNVRVSLPGGDLMVHWSGEGNPVFMTGPANSIYHGTIEL
jgi:diaminopimelate epimerase